MKFLLLLFFNRFASRHSEDSIRSIASRSDDQMSFLLSTIDQIDEIRRVLKLGLFACGETITKNQETPLKWFLLIKKGQEFMLQLVNNSSKNSMTSYAREMRLSSSCSKCTMLLVNTVQRHIRTKLASFKQHLLVKLMIFQVQFSKSISRTSLIFLVEILIIVVWLVNVVGQIVNFGSLENKIIKGKDNMRLLIELRDPNNVKMMCTLWGCYAKQVYNYSRSNMSTMIICVIRFSSVKEWKGAYSISSGLPDDSLALTKNDSSQWSVGTATSICARFFVLNERLTIREIIDSTLVGTFVTLESIETIDTERGWQCLKHSDVISRFKLIAHVKDDSGEANFLLFDANTQQIVRHSAAELYDENEDEDFLPEAVSDLFGKRVLFEISVDVDNIKRKSSQYVVRLATDDREMVEEFADLPPKPQLLCPKEKANKMKTVALRINTLLTRNSLKRNSRASDLSLF
ncbi:unnamed protein product [Brassica napus]|uniref:(rape) hypothetical protein n=1 Tax=Brassica napus TaxID=3708 RepID=A0A816KC85_BRANA|nr:unnamed protein product [Brassica napus]